MLFIIFGNKTLFNYWDILISFNINMDININVLKRKKGKKKRKKERRINIVLKVNWED